MSFVRHGRNSRGRKNSRGTIPESKDGYVVQVHFAGRPATTKRLMNTLRRDIQAYLDALRSSGQLLIAGRYLSSVGGMWLLKVRTMGDAERIARDYPPIKKDYLTFRINVLVDTDNVLMTSISHERDSSLQPA
ncbi:MAG: hypothetical protein KDB65_07645 [Calditrichaeota bacterium]|nr:hypothetical protein [Calditrichota bacterium]MCB9369343.1 hypothetical protein [Calditrichota bacterium]